MKNLLIMLLGASNFGIAAITPSNFMSGFNIFMGLVMLGFLFRKA